MKSNDVIKDLIKKIISEELPISSRMPSESQLSIKYKCNRHTIRKAINFLIERNYLIKDSTGANYVNNFSFYDNNKLFVSSLSDLYVPQEIKSNIHKFENIKAPESICNYLNIEKNSAVWYIVRIRYVSSKPNHMEEIYMPYSLFPDLTKKDCESSLLSYIESQYDFKISHGIKNISAIKLDESECEFLDLPKDSIVMKIENIGYLTNSRIYEYSISKSRENNLSYYCRR